MDCKVFVGVTAHMNPDGKIDPLAIEWEDGNVFEIDRILDVRKAASLKAGGSGLRYQVRIKGRDTFIFLDPDNRWFVERKAH